MKRHLEIGYRPTWAEVSLGSIEHNIKELRKLILPHTKIMGTVKADAYGHGLIPVAKRLFTCGVDYFGVASIDEGIKLRKEGIRLPILVLGMVLKEDIAPLFEYELTPTVCTLEMATFLNQKALNRKQKLNLHVKVDTGMARIGVRHEDAFALVKKICRMKFLNIEGIYTHFAFADMSKEFTDMQIRLFESLAIKLNDAGIYIPLVHAANSIGVIDYYDGHFNMVRPGIVMYGLSPKDDMGMRLKPALTLKTKVVFVKRVPKGQGVSYGHIYVTNKSTTIVTLPIGYGDGYPRNLSNLAPVLIKGRRFLISGRVCMDQIMVDVGNLAVKVGEEVVLIGSQGNNCVSAEELARLSGTIPYEIVCGLGNRVPRIYV